MFTSNFYRMLASIFRTQSKSDASNQIECVDYTGTAYTNIMTLWATGNTWIEGFIPFAYAGSASTYESGIPQSGTILGITNNTTMYYGNSTTAWWAHLSGVIIGDGDAAPNIDDYCLSGNQITDFSAISSLVITYPDGKLQATANYSITNTGASPFTIKEIAATYTGREYGTSNDHRILYERSVLDVPVTIQPGNTGTLIYKISVG